MRLKFLAVLAAVAIGLTGFSGHVPDADAAKKKYKVVVVKKKVVKKIVIVPKCRTVTGGGQAKGGVGTENKARAKAIADWQRQAGKSFTGTTTCKRDVITVRCLAIGSTCSG